MMAEQAPGYINVWAGDPPPERTGFVVTRFEWLDTTPPVRLIHDFRLKGQSSEFVDVDALDPGYSE